ncbi:CYTH domain-containing protein [Sulfurirhabdus autotrophica]|nr:CYTH domain-containing protein [Sulfurirhabdus autotrophica]
MHTEIELKLLINKADIPALMNHPLLNGINSERKSLRNIYLDTPDLTLVKQKMAFRMRLVDSLWIQTVKGGGKVEGGLHQRNEWEVEVEGEKPDFEKLAQSPWYSVFTPEVQDAMMPVFETNFWRTTWLLELPRGVVELALDVGEIQVSNLTEPICEVELELKSGEPEALFELAELLNKTVTLQTEDKSKAERGYALFAKSKSLKSV